MTISILNISVSDLHHRLGFTESLDYPESSLSKQLTQWKMEQDDAPIFRYLYRNFGPRRHLEFGTWQGTGVLYCLEECDATVWTINLPNGERHPDETWAYGESFDDPQSLPRWSNKQVCSDENGKEIIWYQTDALGFIGRYYRQKGLGHRVCQIYCDSQKWDTSNYPQGFFDSALIDGGHTEDVVLSDTRKSLELLRPGGMILWHDFCPDQEVYNQCASTRGVYHIIQRHWEEINSQMQDIFWIEPSWILLGIKKVF